MRIGETAPNFILKDEKGNDFELYKNLDTNVLIAFYPKDDTPVCSAQLADYNDHLDEFRKNGFKVIGISTDSVESHASLYRKLNLNFPLLADFDKKVSRRFNAINLIGLNKRLLVFIGIDKKVIWADSTIPITYISSQKILEKVGLLIAKK